MVLIAKFILLLLMLVLAVVLTIYLIPQITAECQYRHTDSYRSVMNLVKLDKDGQFTTVDGRLIAQSIYTYRSKFLYDITNTDNNYIDIFSVRSPVVPYTVDMLSDVALYKLVVCSEKRFSRVMTFVYVYNNPLYTQCINAYNPTTKTFSEIISGRSTRDIIVKDILKFGDESTADLKAAIQQKISRVDVDPNISDAMITGVVDTLNSAPEEELYNLIEYKLVE
jgi:hypothetical protein